MLLAICEKKLAIFASTGNYFRPCQLGSCSTSGVTSHRQPPGDPDYVSRLLLDCVPVFRKIIIPVYLLYRSGPVDKCRCQCGDNVKVSLLVWRTRYTDTFCNAVDCRFELALKLQKWTRARSECLPGPKIIVTPLVSTDLIPARIGLLSLTHRVGMWFLRYARGQTVTDPLIAWHLIFNAHGMAAKSESIIMSCLPNYQYTGWAKKRGHRLMTIILSILNRFKKCFRWKIPG